MWGNVMLQRYHVIYDRFDLIWFIDFYFIMWCDPTLFIVVCVATREQQQSRGAAERAERTASSKQLPCVCCVPGIGWDGGRCAMHTFQNGKWKQTNVPFLFIFMDTYTVCTYGTYQISTRTDDEMTWWFTNRTRSRVVPTSQLPNSQFLRNVFLFPEFSHWIPIPQCWECLTVIWSHKFSYWGTQIFTSFPQVTVTFGRFCTTSLDNKLLSVYCLNRPARTEFGCIREFYLDYFFEE